jgi:hypothetical protein
MTYPVVNNPKHQFYGYEVLQENPPHFRKCPTDPPEKHGVTIDAFCDEVRSNMPIYHSLEEWETNRPMPLFITEENDETDSRSLDGHPEQAAGVWGRIGQALAIDRIPYLGKRWAAARADQADHGAGAHG